MMRWLLVLACVGWGVPREGTGLKAQGVDRGLWSGFGVQHRWTERWSGSLGLETRWGNDARAHRSSFGDASVEFAFSKRYALDFQFRTSVSGSGVGDWQPVQRVALRLLGNWKVGPGKVEARAMWQHGRLGAWHPEMGWSQPARTTVRLRLGYEGPRWGPVRLGVNLEPMARMSDGAPTFSALRFRFDSDWKLGGPWRAGLGYQWEQDYNRAFPERSHTVRWGLTYQLPDRKVADTPAQAAESPPVPLAVQDTLAPPFQIFRADGQPVLEAVAVLLPVCQAGDAYVSEVQTQGQDFIEWHNPSSRDCSLEGWRVDDDPTLADWRGTAAHWIPAGGYVVLYGGGPGGFGSGLGAKGEVLYWSEPSGLGGQLQLDPAVPGTSQHFFGDGRSGMQPPTPGRPEPRP